MKPLTSHFCQQRNFRAVNFKKKKKLGLPTCTLII